MNIIKSYRLKHKPTGLYYKPATGYDWVKTNLSKTGKVYLTKTNALIGSNTEINIQITAKQYNKMKDIFDKYDIKKLLWRLWVLF